MSATSTTSKKGIVFAASNPAELPAPPLLCLLRSGLIWCQPKAQEHQSPQASDEAPCLYSLLSAPSCQ